MTTISNIPLLKHRDTVVTLTDQDEFVSKYEATNDHLSNTFVPEINALASELNVLASNGANAITLNSIAELKEFETVGRVDVLGYYAKGDGGGGTFYWDSASTEADNGGTIIQATGITTGRWKRVYSGAVNVKWFGVSTSRYDNEVPLQSLLNLVSGTGTVIEISDEVYVTSNTVTFDKQIIISNNATISCSNNSAIGLIITGGAYFTEITGKLSVTRQNIWTEGSSQIIGAYGIKINCRVKADSLLSYGHYYDGVNFNATSNLNKSTYKLIEAYNNARHGCYFNGSQNDMSVWNINMRCQSNYSSGIFFEDTSPARQFSGHFYTEDNCKDTVSYGCYLGGLSSSDLYIYSEEQNTNKEIILPESGARNKIFSGRASSDTNLQRTSSLVSGSSTEYYGATGSTIEKSFKNLTANPTKYWDIIKQTSSGEIFQDRYYGSGVTSKLVMNAGTLNSFSELIQTPSALSFIVNNGTPALPSSITAGTSWELNFQGNTTDTRGQANTNFASIKITANTVGGGNKGTGTLTFRTANSTSSATDKVSINGVGNMFANTDNTQTLGSASLRWSTIYAGTGTINTSDDRLKTYLTIEDKEVLVATELKKLMRKYKFNDAIEEKGEDKARIHFGTSAQAVKKVFEDNGLNAFDYALLCYDEWEDEYETKIIKEAILDEDGNEIEPSETKEVLAIKAGNRYGIRYDELLCFIISAI